MVEDSDLVMFARDTWLTSTLLLSPKACEPIRRLSESSVSAVGGALPPSSSTTPVSLETGYSSLRQDTPQSQGTPHTPRQSGTPFSQESNFSSRQSTPVYPSSRAESSGSYKSRRHESKFQDAYNRRPERPQYRSNMYRSTTSEPAPFKQNQLTPPEPPPSTPSFTYTPPLPATPNFKSAFSPYQAPLPPAFPPSEPAFHNAAQREGEYLRPPEPPLAAATDFLPVKERPETPPIPEPPPEPMPVPHPTTPPPQTPEHCPSPVSPTLDLERNSLDSRIEMLLKEKKTKLLPFLEERDSDTEVRMEGSPISSSSSQLSPIPPFTSGSQGGQQNSRPSSTGLEDISPTPLPESEDEDPTPGTAVLIKRISSPVQETTSNSDLKDGHPRGHTPTETVEMVRRIFSFYLYQTNVDMKNYYLKTSMCEVAFHPKERDKSSYTEFNDSLGSLMFTHSGDGYTEDTGLDWTRGLVSVQGDRSKLSLFCVFFFIAPHEGSFDLSQCPKDKEGVCYFSWPLLLCSVQIRL